MLAKGHRGFDLVHKKKNMFLIATLKIIFRDANLPVVFDAIC